VHTYAFKYKKIYGIICNLLFELVLTEKVLTTKTYLIKLSSWKDKKNYKIRNEHFKIEYFKKKKKKSVDFHRYSSPSLLCRVIPNIGWQNEDTRSAENTFSPNCEITDLRRLDNDYLSLFIIFIKIRKNKTKQRHSTNANAHDTNWRVVTLTGVLFRDRVSHADTW